MLIDWPFLVFRFPALPHFLYLIPREISTKQHCQWAVRQRVMMALEVEDATR